MNTKSLFEDYKTSLQLKSDLRYDVDYVAIPERIWTGFNSWYGPAIPIKKKVIQFEVFGDKKRTSRNPDFLILSRQVTLRGNMYVWEIEVDEIFILYSLIPETGVRFDKAKRMVDGGPI